MITTLQIRSLSQRQAPQTRFRHLHFQEGAAAVPLNEAVNGRGVKARAGNRYTTREDA